MNWFVELDDARIEVARGRQDYNEVRPRRALDGLTPQKHADNFNLGLTPRAAWRSEAGQTQ